MAKCKHETKNGTCEIHSSYSYCHLCDSENLCKGYEPKTNADRIRAMSDEELADWIARTQMGAIKDAMNLLRLPCDATDGVVELGKTEALEWLQQPAEE